MPRSLTTALGLLLFALTIFSAACSRPCPAGRAVLPPEALTQSVEVPRPAGQTNADLAAWILDLLSALNISNQDKAALREWAARMRNHD